MRAGNRFGLKMLGYYVGLLIVSMLFLNIDITWLQVVLNIALLAGFAVLLINDGGYTGEKAATVTATVERQQKEGRPVFGALLDNQWDRKVALVAFLVAVLPLFLLAAANLIYKPVYDAKYSAFVEKYGPPDAIAQVPDVYDPDAEVEVREDAPVNWLGVLTRIAFAPFISLYTLLKDQEFWLYLCFLPLSLILPAFGAAGYLMGPKLREKKLAGIEKGIRRRRRGARAKRRNQNADGPKREV